MADEDFERLVFEVGEEEPRQVLIRRGDTLRIQPHPADMPRCRVCGAAMNSFWHARNKFNDSPKFHVYKP